jgi:hypothetical protein
MPLHTQPRRLITPSRITPLRTHATYHPDPSPRDEPSLALPHPAPERHAGPHQPTPGRHAKSNPARPARHTRPPPDRPFLPRATCRAVPAQYIPTRRPSLAQTRPHRRDLLIRTRPARRVQPRLPQPTHATHHGDELRHATPPSFQHDCPAHTYPLPARHPTPYFSTTRRPAPARRAYPTPTPPSRLAGPLPPCPYQSGATCHSIPKSTPRDCPLPDEPCRCDIPNPTAPSRLAVPHQSCLFIFNSRATFCAPRKIKNSLLA